MQSRTRVIIAAAVVLLAAGTGLLLLSLRGRGSEPTSASPAPPSPQPSASTTAIIPPTTSPVVPSPTPGPLLYTIQEGDTLMSIATDHGISVQELIAANGLDNPDVIFPGQVLVIPNQFAPTPLPSVPPTGTPPTPSPAPSLPPPPATPTFSGPVQVEIAGALGVGDVSAEVVRIRNRGGTVSFEDWSLSSSGGERFNFPRLVLFPGTEVVIHSGPGESSPMELYWGRAQPAWESGELLTLRNGEGAVVDTYLIP